MKKKRRGPPVIQCPKCHCLRIHRRARRCAACGHRLIFVGELFPFDEDAHFWHPKQRKWIHVSTFADGVEI